MTIENAGDATWAAKYLCVPAKREVTGLYAGLAA
jgi:hypothetical protein